jgi:hypothetical protein
MDIRLPCPSGNSIYFYTEGTANGYVLVFMDETYITAMRIARGGGGRKHSTGRARWNFEESLAIPILNESGA